MYSPIIISYEAKLFAIVVLVAIEILAHNYWTNLSWNIRTILFYMAGFSIALIPMIKHSSYRKFPKINPHYFWLLLCFVAIAIYTLSVVNPLLITDPISVESADMLPVIQTMSERYLNGDSVYESIPYIWNGTQPIYLPAMWMPYTLGAIFDFDLRWISAIALILGLFFTTTWIFLKCKLSLWHFIPLALALLVIYCIFKVDHRFLIHTEEPLVVGYYLFLVFALMKRNIYYISIALALCLLSRYSLLIWAIMLLLYIYKFESKQNAKIMFWLTGGIMLFLMTISQAIFNIDIFVSLPDVYESAVLDESLKWKYEPLIQSSLGLAKYFDYDSMQLVSWIFKITFFTAPFICYGIFLRFRKQIDQNLFLVCSLKICLILFYGFLIMPFKYLFFTSIAVSIGIFATMLLTDGKQATMIISK